MKQAKEKKNITSVTVCKERMIKLQSVPLRSPVVTVSELTTSPLLLEPCRILWWRGRRANASVRHKGATKPWQRSTAVLRAVLM